MPYLLLCVIQIQFKVLLNLVPEFLAENKIHCTALIFMKVL